MPIFALFCLLCCVRWLPGRAVMIPAPGRARVLQTPLVDGHQRFARGNSASGFRSDPGSRNLAADTQHHCLDRGGQAAYQTASPPGAGDVGASLRSVCGLPLLSAQVSEPVRCTPGKQVMDIAAERHNGRDIYRGVSEHISRVIQQARHSPHPQKHTRLPRDRDREPVIKSRVLAILPRYV